MHYDNREDEQKAQRKELIGLLLKNIKYEDIKRMLSEGPVLIRGKRKKIDEQD